MLFFCINSVAAGVVQFGEGEGHAPIFTLARVNWLTAKEWKCKVLLVCQVGALDGQMNLESLGIGRFGGGRDIE